MNAIVSKIVAVSFGAALVVAAAVVPSAAPTRVAIFHNCMDCAPHVAANSSDGINSRAAIEPTRVAIFHNCMDCAPHVVASSSDGVQIGDAT